MPLPTVVVDVPLAGVDEKTARELVQPGKMIAVDNGIFVKKGEVRKRNGFSTISNTVTPGNIAYPPVSTPDGNFLSCQALLTRNGELLEVGDCTTFTRKVLASYSEGRQVWDVQDFPENLLVEKKFSQVYTNASVSNTSAATRFGYAMYTWSNGGDVQMSVVDQRTGTVIPNGIDGWYAISGASYPRCVNAGNCLVTLYILASEIHWIVFNTVTHNWSQGQTHVASEGVLLSFDACEVDANTVAVCAVRSPGNHVDLFTINLTTNTVQNRTPGVGTADPDSISVAYEVNTNPPLVPRLYVAHSDGTDTYASAFTLTLSGWHLEGTDLIQSGGRKARVCVYRPERAVVLSQDATPTVVWAMIDETATVVASPALVMAGLELASDPWICPSDYWDVHHVYALMSYHDSLGVQDTVAIVRFDAYETLANSPVDLPVVVGQLAVRAGPSDVGYPETWKVGVDKDTGEVTVAVPARQRVLETSTVTGPMGQYGIAGYGLTYNSQKGLLYAEAQNCTHIAGGALMSYDGRRLSEIGFLTFPTLTASAASGSGLGIGTYSYVCVYSWQDSQGRIHRSAPSAPATITTTSGNQKGTLQVQACHVSWRERFASQSPIYVEVYRTLVDGAVTSSLDNFYYAGRFQPSLNTVSSTYNDTATDADIADNPQIYTAGGVLEAVMPPGCSVVTLHKNRIWINSSEDDDVLWFSRELSSGEAPAFNEILTVAVPGGGKVTGLSPMDTRLIVFKEDRVFVVYGDGPNDQGAGGQFTAEQLQPIQLGCVDTKSVARTSFGTFFYSPQGLFVMTRSLDAQQVGARVEDTLSQYHDFAGIVSMPTNQEVRLVARNKDTDLSSVLVYNTFFDEWSTWTVRGPSGNPINTVATAICNNKHYLADEAGTVCVESQGTWRDGFDNQWVTFSVTSPWLRLGAVEGFQRVRRVGLRSRGDSPYALTFTVRSDYDSYGNGQYPEQQSSFTWADSVESSRFAQVHIQQQTAPSIQVTIADADPGVLTTGKGPYLVGLSLELGQKQGADKLPAAWRK